VILFSSSKICFFISSSLGVKKVSIWSSGSLAFLDAFALSMLVSPLRISPKSRVSYVIGSLEMVSISEISSSDVKNVPPNLSSTIFSTYISSVVLLSLAFTSLALSTISNLNPKAPPRFD